LISEEDNVEEGEEKSRGGGCPHWNEMYEGKRQYREVFISLYSHSVCQRECGTKYDINNEFETSINV
jgi:hypothetical protein